MNADDLCIRLTVLSQRRRADTQALHKLLLLPARADLHNAGRRRLPYREVAERLAQLPRVFGPCRVRINVRYPCWRLRHDGIWKVRDAACFRPNSSGEVVVTHLRAADAQGGFGDVTWRLLRTRPVLIVSQLANEPGR